MYTTKDLTLIPYESSMKTVDVTFDIGLYSKDTSSISRYKPHLVHTISAPNSVAHDCPISVYLRTSSEDLGLRNMHGSPTLHFRQAGSIDPIDYRLQVRNCVFCRY